MRCGSVRHYQVLFKYDYMFQSKEDHHQAKITKTSKIWCNTVQLCLLRGCILPRLKSFVMSAWL